MSDADQIQKPAETSPPEVLATFTPEDVDDLHRLGIQLVNRPISRDKVQQFLEKAVASPTTRVFVIRDSEHRIQATASGFMGYSPFGCAGWVESVVTDESFRGRGCALLLMNTLHAWFKSEGAVSSNLTSNIAREAAGKLYEKMGYVHYETRVYRLQLDD